ncbi:MAG: septum formation initiator family protein [Actinomycetota bacterium]|nr:septum formation initiator family protein [Actinomycetota bacterium]
MRTLVVLVALGGLLFLFVLPGRTWLQQRGAMSGAEHRLQILNAENAVLDKKAKQLQTPAYVEQIARNQYGLVRPGEHAYNLLPPTAATSTTTTLPPGAG